ncbi:Spore germination protein GerYA [Geobacillus stearothermophilus]|uniref:Spore germination protein GerYA n=1 Tax=Geobacillus stearothermophilus TaxID=1422 RepID=A0ABQ7HIE4_GEOSE|nr:Spore germination protein GerYA [Geobacillus stearothermophilus]
MFVGLFSFWKKKKKRPPQRPISQLWETLRQSSDFVEVSFVVGGKELSIYTSVDYPKLDIRLP